MSAEPTQPRIAPLEGATSPAPLNIFTTLAHNEPLAKGFMRLGGHLLQGGVLDGRTREIVILRVGWRAGSEYEFGQHSVIGAREGVTSDEIARLADANDEPWASEDQILIDMVDELCDDNLVSPATWSALSSRFTDAQMLELLVLAGYYRLVSGMLNSVGVALEPVTPGWPEGSTPIRRAPRASS